MKIALSLLIFIIGLVMIKPSKSMISQKDLSYFIEKEKQKGSQMEETILKQFLMKPIVRQVHDLIELEESYQLYRKDWQKKMVEEMISSLGISAQEATEARKNPDMFHLNYETYKLLSYA